MTVEYSGVTFFHYLISSPVLIGYTRWNEVERVYTEHGVPERIQSDNGGDF